jgi:hypothetical protein
VGRGLAAIATNDDIVREHAIDAGFEEVDGYLHASLRDDASDQPEHLKADAMLAGELGSMRSTSNRCRWWAGQACALRIRPASIRVSIRYSTRSDRLPAAFVCCEADLPITISTSCTAPSSSIGIA